MLQAYHLAEVQGTQGLGRRNWQSQLSRPAHDLGEQRTELYGISTAKEQAQPVTPQSAKSPSGAACFTSRQAGVVRSP